MSPLTTFNFTTKFPTSPFCVTKYATLAQIEQLLLAGEKYLGENKVQDTIKKIDNLEIKTNEDNNSKNETVPENNESDVKTEKKSFFGNIFRWIKNLFKKEEN